MCSSLNSRLLGDNLKPTNNWPKLIGDRETGWKKMAVSRQSESFPQTPFFSLDKKWRPTALNILGPIFMVRN